MPQRLSAEWSAQRRIALKTSFAVCLAVLVGTLLVLKADDVADDTIFDQQLEHLSRTLASAVVAEVPQWEEPAGGPNLRRASTSAKSADLLYQVWRRDGTLLRHSPQSSASVPLAPLALSGFYTLHMQGQSYRSYSLPSADGTTVVQVAEQIEDRENLRLATLFLYLVSLLLPLYITWRGSRRLLDRSRKFLGTLAAGVATRDPQDARPIQLHESPSDFAPLLESVNGLVERASSVISLEQRFTSVAAHELMSPLAGIRAQAQLARRAASQEELQQSLQAVMTGVDHAARVFEQLLDLTRMEGLSHERQSQFKPIDLQALLQNVHDELRPVLVRKSMRYLESCKARELQGVEFAIYLLLRNLVANAIRYTPEGGTVEVSSVRIGDQLLLCVDDSGPGIPEADRQRVFERFSRLQQSGDEGIGLGLFIAQQAAVLHGASIELLSSPLGGLRAQVCFAKAVQFAI